MKSKPTLQSKYGCLQNMVHKYDLLLISAVWKTGIVRYSEVVAFLLKEINIVANTCQLEHLKMSLSNYLGNVSFFSQQIYCKVDSL